jgi:topoisomerase IA-like protein
MTKEQDSKSIRELGIDPETGKSVTAVQFEDRTRFSVLIGNNKDLDFKFRSLRIKERLKYRFDSITLSEALDILRLPRSLGQTSEGGRSCCRQWQLWSVYSLW